MKNHDENDPSKEEAAPAKVAALKQIRDQFKGNASATQRERLKAAFQLYPSLCTQEIREDLDILHPAGRIQELRDAGGNILTLWTTIESDGGGKHRVADCLWVAEVAHA